MGVLCAQNNVYDPSQVQQQIDRLERLLELQQQVQQQENSMSGAQNQPSRREKREQKKQNTRSTPENNSQAAYYDQGATYRTQDYQRPTTPPASQGGQTQPVGRWYQGLASPGYEPSKPTQSEASIWYQSRIAAAQAAKAAQAEQDARRSQGGQGGQGGPGSQGGQGNNRAIISARRYGDTSTTVTTTTEHDGSVSFNFGPQSTTPAFGDTPRRTPRIALKTNMLYAISTITPNIGVDVGLSDHTTIGVLAGYNNWHNLWDNSNTGPSYDPKNAYLRKLDHTYGRVEFRYWFSQRFEKHSVGAYVFGTDYFAGDVSLPPIFAKKFAYDGIAYGGGVSYGYLWRWSNVVGLEFTLGLGVAVTQYKKQAIKIEAQGYSLAEGTKHRQVYVGPTSIGINLMFKI
jgi:hypothetical protein